MLFKKSCKDSTRIGQPESLKEVEGSRNTPRAIFFKVSLQELRTHIPMESNNKKKVPAGGRGRECKESDMTLTPTLTPPTTLRVSLLIPQPGDFSGS